MKTWPKEIIYVVHIVNFSNVLFFCGACKKAVNCLFLTGKKLLLSQTCKKRHLFSLLRCETPFPLIHKHKKEHKSLHVFSGFIYICMEATFNIPKKKKTLADVSITVDVVLYMVHQRVDVIMAICTWQQTRPK